MFKTKAKILKRLSVIEFPSFCINFIVAAGNTAWSET